MVVELDGSFDWKDKVLEVLGHQCPRLPKQNGLAPLLESPHEHVVVMGINLRHDALDVLAHYVALLDLEKLAEDFVSVEELAELALTLPCRNHT